MEEKCFLYDKCNHIDCDKELCLRRFKLEFLFSRAGIPDNKRLKSPLYPDEDGTDYNEFVQLSAIEKDITQFVNSGRHLYIYSTNTGNGKSSWAYRLASAYLYKNWNNLSLDCHALFVVVSDLFKAVKNNITVKDDYYNTIKDYLTTADVVVFDDIADKSGTSFELEFLFGIINTRLTKGLSCIFTSNVDKTGLMTALGPRLASRIFESSTAIRLNGADKRFALRGGSK